MRKKVNTVRSVSTSSHLPDSATTEALSHSERRYRRLFEAARDGILLLDIDTGAITDANPFMTELLGYSHAELLGKQLFQIGLFEDEEASQNAFLHLRQHGYIRYEGLPLQTHQGERREVEFVSNVYRESDKIVIQCNIRDITARKHLEAELRTTMTALKAALARERRITKILQRPLVQNVPEEMFPGLSLAVLHEAILDEASVGGDFFDAFPADETKVALVIGDVAGKGLVAALMAGRVKDITRAFLRENADTALTLSRVNEYLCDAVSVGDQQSDTAAYVALSLAVIDTQTGVIHCSSGGSEPATIFRTDQTVETIDAHGLLLGVNRGETYPSVSHELGSGDIVLFTTDGITEARRVVRASPENALEGDTPFFRVGPEREGIMIEFLSYSGMIEIARRHLSGSSIGMIGKTIFDEARAFGGTFQDDTCLLLIRRR